MNLKISLVLAILMLLATSLVTGNEIPVCDVQSNNDEVVRAEDIQKLHNCRTKRFPISLQNGFTHDLGQYTGSWVNGKREGLGSVASWISTGMTSSWKNDYPSNGLASFSSCTSQTYGYIYNREFFSFTLLLDWLIKLTSKWDLPLLPEIFSTLRWFVELILSAALK